MWKIALAFALTLVLGYFFVFVVHLQYKGISPPVYDVQNKQRRVEPKVIPYYEGFPFPLKHTYTLFSAGLSFEEVVRIATVYEKYKRAYAFVKLPNPISDKEAYQLARYTCIVSGEGCEPLLIVAILKSEVMRKVGIGGCRYAKGKAPKAFQELIARTRSHHPWITVSYPVVSYSPKGGCGGDIGIFQMRPRVYLAYEPKVREVLGINHFVPPWHHLAGFFAAAFLVSDIARFYGELPENVNIENPELFKKVAATYNAGKRWRFPIPRRYGERVYKTALKLSREIKGT